MSLNSHTSPSRRAILLQLSDIHLKDNVTNRILTRTQLIVDAVRSCAFGPNKDLVVVLSGDLAFKGTPAEYALARQLFDDLKAKLEATGEYGQVHWVVIPGNHDCVLPTDDEARLTLADKIIAEQNYSESMLEGCVKAQDHYSEFVSQYFGTQFSSVYDKLYRFQPIEIGRHTLGFHLFNTAWLSRRHEKAGQLAIPIGELPVKTNGCDVAVAVLHHPDNWLDPSYNRRAVRAKLEKVADLAFTGHEHQSAEYQKSSQSNLITYIEGGVLQDSDNANNSGFNVLVLDLDTKEYQSYIFKLRDERYRCREMNPAPQAFKEKSLMRDEDFVFQKDFLAQLAKGGVTIADDSGHELKLGDYFVYPDLTATDQDDVERRELTERKRSGNATSRNPEVIRSEQVLDTLCAYTKVMVTGDRRAGKSALAATATLDLSERGYVPLLLNGAELRFADPRRLHQTLSAAYDRMYNRPEFGVYLQGSPDLRLLIIDDFDATRLGHSQLDATLSYLGNIFGRMLLISQSGVTLSLPLGDEERERPLAAFKRFEIRPFGKHLSLTLIKKFLTASRRQTSGFTEQEFVRNIDEIQKAVQVVLRSNFLASYPIFILLVLQHRQLQPNQGVRNASYGYLLEVLIKYNIAKSFQSDERYDTAKRFLSELAMHMYREARYELSEREYQDVFARYKAEYDNNVREESFTADLIRSLILERSDDIYRFRFHFQYFYFTATYLAETIDDVDTQATVRVLSEQLNVKERSEIMVFLAHLSHSSLVTNLVLEAARGTLSDATPINFDTDVEQFERTISKVPEVVRGAFNAIKNREELARHEDERNPDLTSPRRRTLDRDEVETELDVGFKVLDVLGQILRSRAGSLRANQKAELVEAAYDLSRRGMATTLEFLEWLMEYFRSEEFLDACREQVQELSQDELNELVRLATNGMSRVATFASLIFIKRVSAAMGSETLDRTYEVLREKHDNVVVDMIDLSIKLDMYREDFPFTDLKALADRTKDSKYSRSVLQLLVHSHLKLFTRDRSVIQKALSTVGLQQGEESDTLVKR